MEITFEEMKVLQGLLAKQSAEIVELCARNARLAEEVSRLRADALDVAEQHKTLAAIRNGDE